MKNLAAFSAKKVESSSRGKRKRRVFPCRRTVKVEAKSKVILTSFLKIEGSGTFVGAKEGQLIELVGDQNPSPKAPPRSKRRRERTEQRRCQRRSDGEQLACQNN